MDKAVLKHWGQQNIVKENTHIQLQPGQVYVRPGTTDEAVHQKIFVHQEYRVPLRCRFLRRIKTVIDGGAHIGCSTAYFASAFPGARVVAVEPDTENLTLLRKNTAGYANVEVCEGALWATSAPLTINRQLPAYAEHWPIQEGSWHYTVAPLQAPDRESVQGWSIPDIMHTYGLSGIDILKLDIEGAEKELFETNAQVWLDKVHMIIIELHDRKKEGCTQAFDAAMAQCNFYRFELGENIFLVRGRRVQACLHKLEQFFRRFLG